jgi:hypothetical protein
MPVLRINQHPGGAPNRYRIDVSATDIPGFQASSFSNDIAFELTPQDNERIRWYLEDYLQFDEAPAPQFAKNAEALMATCGEGLFCSIFEGSHQGMQLWTLVESHLPTTRIEIATDIAEATVIPWELIRNPHTKTFLALSAESFVRTQRDAQIAPVPMAEPQKVRVLLVICRPRGGDDVPFRSVAGRLATRLTEEARDAFNLDVLRPPTYEQLAATLRLAKERGRPYHIVHFDGHGVYAEAENLARVGMVLSRLKLNIEGTGRRGFLAFEDPASEGNSKFVDGFRLGALLRDAGVPVLVLNACKSAFAEPSAKPKEAKAEAAREEVEAYGSLAQAVVETGVAGVVAMRYSVYVATAAQFVAELYGALARGRRLGEAVASARKHLADKPERRIAYEARPLQDWSVPVVWERAPLRLWPEKPDAASIRISLDESAGAKPGALDQVLPARPDVGFYGRDETLYALDRAFDTHCIVLLHAFAGSGKTATAAEFARWYALTGGVDGPVLFTSFERQLSLDRVLDKIGAVFGKALEAAGIQWQAITDPAQRRHISLQVLQQVPVLWIWDNVEPITGFPAGTTSDWSVEEQHELRAFLSAARETKAKFLLTSRRDENAWLGALPGRVQVPPMPMLERLQFADAILGRRGKRLAQLPDLAPLLTFTLGNPLTILVTLGEALRAGIDTKSRLDAFVAALRRGEVAFEDEQTEGRSKSLGASLSYGFSTAFSQEERKILGLLHLFQGFINVWTLLSMGYPDHKWCLEAVRGLTKDRGIALLDRAAEIGLLNSRGDGLYDIHPALPGYFRTLFEQYFAEDTGDADRARHAFISATAEFGNHYHTEYNKGNLITLGALWKEEDNLLAAWRLARTRGEWENVILAMQGLQTFYEATNRRAAWHRLVEDVTRDFVDQASDGPLPGRERQWRLVTEYRANLLREERNWSSAERLHRMCVDWSRRSAQSALAIAPSKRDAVQRNEIRSVASALIELGRIQLEQRSPTCADSFHEAFDIADTVGDRTQQAVCAFNLGNAYLAIASLRDLDQAERWLRTSHDLYLPEDTFRRSLCLSHLGNIAYGRFRDGARANCPIEELARHLLEAMQLLEQALEIMPPFDRAALAVTHSQLGIVYRSAGEIDSALRHYQECVRYRDEIGDTHGAGEARRDIAMALLGADQPADARAYAEAALANLMPFGDRAADQIEEIERLIVKIDQAIAKQAGASLGSG